LSKPKKGDSKKISILGIEDALREAEQSVERIKTTSGSDLPALSEEEARALAAAEDRDPTGDLGEVIEAGDDEAEPVEEAGDTGEIFELDDHQIEAAASPEGTSKEQQLEDRLIRLAADFDNHKKRVARDQERIRARAAEDLVKALLPVMDNLERALKHAEADPASLVEGVQMVHQQFAEVFTTSGVQGFGEPGQDFDPNVHEALAQHPSDEHAEGAITEIYQKGYMLNDQLIRPALVIVAGPSSSEETPEDDDPASDANAAETDEESTD